MRLSLVGPRETLDFLPDLSEISVMTENTETKALRPAIERFILHWGDMGAQWGVNRSVSQIHALLYLSDRPLTAEEIAETLGFGLEPDPSRADSGRPP